MERTTGREREGCVRRGGRKAGVRTERSREAEARARKSHRGTQHLKKSRGVLAARPAVKYAFIHEHVERFRVTSLCRALCVSRSGYYEWLDRPESRHASQDHQLLKSIRLLHARSREAYPPYQTRKALQAQGIACGPHRVAPLRRENAIKALRKGRFRVRRQRHK